MSARAEIFRTPDLAEAQAQTVAGTRATQAEGSKNWDPSAFAHEQIRRLVRQVFFSNGAPPAKQIVICSAGSRAADVADICEQAGRALAAETSASVAVVGSSFPAARHNSPAALPVGLARDRVMNLRQASVQVASNLWLVPDIALVDSSAECSSGISWQTRLSEVRREFDYSILAAPSAATSSEAALMGHLADGIILVVEAHSTRRASARQIMEIFEAARVCVLGTVLSARTFPVPEWIYQRL